MPSKELARRGTARAVALAWRTRCRDLRCRRRFQVIGWCLRLRCSPKAVIKAGCMGDPFLPTMDDPEPGFCAGRGARFRP